MTGNLKRLRPYEQPPRPRRPLLPDGPDAAATGFFAFAALWFLAATGIGTLAALQMVVPDLQFSIHLPFGVTVEVAPDTVAAGFRHAFVWGWLTNAALGAVFFITPRLTGRPLARPRTGVLGMVVWNVGFTAGLALLYIPALAGGEALTAFPPVVDAVLVGAVALASWSFWASVAPVSRPFVSLAWFGIAMLALLALLAVAALNGVVALGPTAAAVVDAVWLRALSLFWLLAVPIGALHYLVPRLSGNPLASGQLAWVGLGAWAVLGAVACLGAAAHPGIPFALVSAGNAATMALLVPVTAFAGNLSMTLRGRWALLLSPGPVALAVASLAFLGGSILLGGIGSLREVQAAVTRSEWPLGVGALALGGAASLALLAMGEHAWPRVLHRSHTAGPLAYLTTWAAVAGAGLAGVALIAAGLFRIGMTGEGVAPDEITTTLLPVYLLAWAGIGLLGLGATGHAVGAYLLAAHGRPIQTAIPGTAPATAAGH